jgi:glycine oxidase
MPEIDYIIVGQGLAGSFLGYSLIKRKKKILIFDTGEANTSSKIAAGIFNPITGQRMALTWNAHRIFPYLDQYYKELEAVFNERFYFPIGIYKPLLDAKDHNDWMGRSSDSNYMPFIKKIHHESRYGHLINDICGGIELNNSGYVNTIILLSAFKRFFENKKSYFQEKFNQNSLYLYGERASYNDYAASKVIFCEGPSVVHNNYFNWLPFGFVKGEILTLNLDLLPDQIISKDIFILPIEGSMAKAGSTYDWNDPGVEITREAKNYLVKKLTSLLKIGFEVVGQQAGIRPATKDRRPFMGLHPRTKLIGLFNGLGTKGVSLGPYYSEQFADFLVFNKNFDEEVDLRRYI